MIKTDMIPGKKYLRNRQTMIDGVLREAESWMRFERTTPTGAIFSRDFEPEIHLTDAEIAVEISEKQEK